MGARTETCLSWFVSDRPYEHFDAWYLTKSSMLQASHQVAIDAPCITYSMIVDLVRRQLGPQGWLARVSHLYCIASRGIGVFPDQFTQPCLLLHCTARNSKYERRIDITKSSESQGPSVKVGRLGMVCPGFRETESSLPPYLRGNL